MTLNLIMPGYPLEVFQITSFSVSYRKTSKPRDPHSVAIGLKETSFCDVGSSYVTGSSESRTRTSGSKHDMKF
jgi:hypothetical protein